MLRMIEPDNTEVSHERLSYLIALQLDSRFITLGAESVVTNSRRNVSVGHRGALPNCIIAVPKLHHELSIEWGNAAAVKTTNQLHGIRL